MKTRTNTLTGKIGELQIFFNDNSKEIADNGYAKTPNKVSATRVTKFFKVIGEKLIFQWASYTVTESDGSRHSGSGGDGDSLISACGLDQKQIIVITDKELPFILSLEN